MYESAKSSVRLGTKFSDHFYSNVGVRQVENLSPVLFSLFLNDLVEFISQTYDGLTNVYNALIFSPLKVKTGFTSRLLLRFLKITIFVADTFTSNFHDLQYRYIACNAA
jgi:hypothetical protein